MIALLLALLYPLTGFWLGYLDCKTVTGHLGQTMDGSWPMVFLWGMAWPIYVAMNLLGIGTRCLLCGHLYSEPHRYDNRP